MFSAVKISHHSQRYDTLGDWQNVYGNIHVAVSNLNNPDREFLIAIHELVEAYLCKKHCISQEMVDQFDFRFEGVGEPGDMIEAPYHKEHQVATKVERLLAEELGVDWEFHVTNSGEV